MKKVYRVMVSLVLALAVCVSAVPARVVLADSQRIVTLGKDLSESQKSTVLKFFGVEEGDTSINFIEVTNEDEHAVLDGIAPASAIGSKTYSCAYIEPTMSGGIKVKTANLTYVTVNSLYNALQTAGVENCNLIVTAPFEVSGTGALTGVFKAFEQSGKALEEGKQEAAAEELIVGSKLESEYGQGGVDLVSDLKKEVIGSDEDLSDEELKELAEKEANERNLKLSEEELEELTSLLGKIRGLEYNIDAFSQKLSGLSDGLESKVREESSGVWASIKNFFKSIGDFFMGIFGGGGSGETESSEPSIFDSVDTGVYEYDTPTENADEVDEPEEGAEESSSENEELEAESVEEGVISEDGE